MNSQIKVAYPGVPGSFSEQALLQYFTGHHQIINVKTFVESFDLLANEQVDFCVMPIENSSTGGIFEVMDYLQQYNLYIVGETYVKVAHHLLGVPNSDLAEITTVYSHPQGFQQSTKFLQNYPDWNQIPYYNTAISAQYIAEQNDSTKAAIASERAAKIYNLNILVPNIQDVQNNYTRFIVISRELLTLSHHDKISIIYALPHSVGSLYHSLGIFAEHGVNLLNLQSRPIKEIPWQAYFYLDLAGNLADSNVQQALKQVESLSNFFKIIGSYQANLEAEKMPLPIR